MSSRYSSTQNDNYLKKLKDQYINQLSQLNLLFENWEDQDLLMILEECNGDLELAIDRISNGFVSQFSEVKSRKHNKPKSNQSKDNENDRSQRNSSRGSSRGRGGGVAGRGGYSNRGGRGRGKGSSMGRNQSNQGNQGLSNKTSNGSIQNKRNHEKNANIDNTIEEEKINENSKSENKENKNEKQNNWKPKGAWSKGAPGYHDQSKNNNNNNNNNNNSNNNNNNNNNNNGNNSNQDANKPIESIIGTKEEPIGKKNINKPTNYVLYQDPRGSTENTFKFYFVDQDFDQTFGVGKKVCGPDCSYKELISNHQVRAVKVFLREGTLTRKMFDEHLKSIVQHAYNPVALGRRLDEYERRYDVEIQWDFNEGTYRNREDRHHKNRNSDHTNKVISYSDHQRGLKDLRKYIETRAKTVTKDLKFEWDPIPMEPREKQIIMENNNKKKSDKKSDARMSKSISSSTILAAAIVIFLQLLL